MAFNIPSQWGFAKASPTSAPKTWTRPSDWPVVTDTPNEIKFLASDAAFLKYSLKYAFETTSGPGNLYVDWGDGSSIDTLTFVDGNDYWITHTYVAGTGTPCSRGYTTFVIRIYYDPGVVVRTVMLDGGNNNLPFSVNSVATNCGVLEMVYGDGIPMSDFTGLATAANRSMYFNLLEYIKLPSVIIPTSTSALASLANSSGLAASAPNGNLAKVILPTNTGTTYALNLDSTFNGCGALLEVTFPTTCIIGTFSSIFQNCFSLQSVTLPPGPNVWDTVVSWNSSFQNCRLLTTINNMPSYLAACTNFGATFQGCNSLNNITIPRFGVSVQMGTAFQGCTNLRQVSFAGWNSGVYAISVGINNIFQECDSLLSITFPVNFDAQTLRDTFLNCRNLRSVIFQSPCPNLTSMQTAFSSCQSLQSVTLPSTVSGSGVNLTSTFLNCVALESITFPSGFSISNATTAFSTCRSLKYITMPSSAPLCTTFLSAFTGCDSLISVTLPSGLDAVSTMQTAFQNCFSLQSVTFPSTMNSCTTMAQTFSGCRSLESVTLPTSMPLLGSFANCFQTCASLQSVTLPATTSATISYTSAFDTCFNLKTVTLPTTQSTGAVATAFLNMFNRSAMLQTVTNMDKLGNNSTVGTIITSFTSAFSQGYSLTSINLSCRLSGFSAGGQNVASLIPTKLTSVRLTNTGTGQWTGASPQVNVAYTGLSTAALVTLFNDLAAQGNVTAKTIDITNSTGAAGLTAADRLIVTSKGWTITG